MHRTDAADNVANLFVESTPGVAPSSEVDANWLNAVQEELANAIEAAAITLAASGAADTSRNQLLAALRKMGLNSQTTPAIGASHAGKQRCYFFAGLDGTNGSRIDITINAAWNSGSSQWDLDSSTSPAILLRLAAGSAGGIGPASANIQVFRNDGGVSFAEADWSRVVNPVIALSFGAHWSNAGAGTRLCKHQTGIDGVVHLSGAAVNDGTAGTVATGLPAPSGTVIFPVAFDNAGLGTAYAQIDSSGNLTVGASGVGVTVYFDGISYTLS